MTADIVEQITQAINSVEHPSIAATLSELGIVQDIEITENGVRLSLFMPFPQIPESIQNFMINSLQAAIRSAGGEIQEVKLSVMDDAERANFLAIETQNWRR